VVLLLSLILTVLIVSVLLLLSMLEVHVFSGYRRDVLRYSLVFVVAVPLQYMLENILKGENKILEIVLLRICPGLTYLIVGGALFYNNILDLQSALNLYLATIASVALIVLIRLKPVLDEVLKVAAVIYHEIKRYGFYVYQGIVANVGTTLLGSLFLALLVDTESMGYFVLARTVSSPLVQIAENIGTVFFRKFASIEIIPVKLFMGVIVIMILSLVLFLLLIGVFVESLYPEEFLIVIELAYITSIGSVAHGFGGFINNYLCAQGYGKKTRNAAFAQGLTNCFGFTVLVYFFGMYGAAITVVISAFVFASIILFYYFNLSNSKRGIQ